MLFLLTILLGTCFAGQCRDGDNAVDLLQQDQDLQDALAPFTQTAASDPGSDGDGLEDVSSLFSVSDDAPTSTECRMRVSRRWPHEDAEPEEATNVRRLLQRGRGRRGRRGKVGFSVDSTVFSPLQRKKRRNYECYNDGSVAMEVKSVEYYLSTGESTAQDDDPRRQLHSDDDEAEVLPYAVVTLTQTNNFPEEDTDATVPVSFDIEVRCKPMYKSESDVCVLKGVRCWDGSYTYFYDDSSEEGQQTKTKTGLSLKCSHVDGFFNAWDDCVAQI